VINLRAERAFFDGVAMELALEMKRDLILVLGSGPLSGTLCFSREV
jgi:hypothetical protein